MDEYELALNRLSSHIPADEVYTVLMNLCATDEIIIDYLYDNHPEIFFELMMDPDTVAHARMVKEINDKILNV